MKAPSLENQIQGKLQQILTEIRNNEKALSFSSSSKFNLESPVSFIKYFLKERDDTKATDYGSLVHALVLLSQEGFKDQYIYLDESKRPFPNKNYQTKANREWKAEETARIEASGKLVALQSDVELALNNYNRALEDTYFKAFMDTVIQTELYVSGLIGSRKIHGYCDIVRETDQYGKGVWDLKVLGQGCSNSALRKKIRYDGVDMQLTKYRLLTGATEMGILGVDYVGNVNMMRISDEQYKYCLTVWHEWINRISDWLENPKPLSYSYWATNTDGINELQPSAWILEQIQN